jgi:hypothetical protein
MSKFVRLFRKDYKGNEYPWLVNPAYVVSAEVRATGGTELVMSDSREKIIHVVERFEDVEAKLSGWVK